MTAERCAAVVEVALGSHAEEGAVIRCDLETGHADPSRAIGARPVLPFHRAEWLEGTFAGVQAPDQPPTVRVEVTWRDGEPAKMTP